MSEIILASVGWNFPNKKPTQEQKIVLEKGFNLFFEKQEENFKNLGISKINKVVVGENSGGDSIGLRIAEKLGKLAWDKIEADWDNYSSSEAAKRKNEQILENATHATLFCYGGKYGGFNLLETLVKKNIPTLVVRVDTEESFVAQGDKLAEMVKTNKPIPTLDFIEVIEEEEVTEKKKPRKHTPRFTQSEVKTIVEHMANSGDYLAFDTETNGRGKEAEIIELAFTEIKTGITIFRTLLSTRNPNSPGAFAVNGIKDEDRIGMPTFAEVFPLVDILLRKFHIVAFNEDFDRGMLRQEYERLGKRLPSHIVSFTCMMKLAKDWFKVADIKQQVACERLGIVNKKPHSADGDTEALAEIIRTIANDETI